MLCEKELLTSKVMIKLPEKVEKNNPYKALSSFEYYYA